MVRDCWIKKYHHLSLILVRNWDQVPQILHHHNQIHSKFLHHLWVFSCQDEIFEKEDRFLFWNQNLNHYAMRRVNREEEENLRRTFFIYRK